MMLTIDWTMPIVLADVLLTPAETAALWGLHHPYWLIAIAISLIILLQLSLSILSQLLKRLLKWLGHSPFSLGRWLMTKTATGVSPQEQQIETILQRLNSLQEEQSILLRELTKQLPNQD
ncbi:MAG: hypothetical protein KTR27_18280 [Leptolyngbyaceae cyanobacterium MAG.088]|nr:hypothetical protein [Leptolyngbyaceae cyanobacterium MAG.088]